MISNCVMNLAADKPAVFREIARVLRPGGRIGISDIVAEDRSAGRTLRAWLYAGCIAGRPVHHRVPRRPQAAGCRHLDHADPRRRRRDPQRDHCRDQAGGRDTARKLARRAVAAGRVGSVLLMQVERAGSDDLYLLTDIAETWFERRGYRTIERDAVPEPVRGSIEFTTACSTTAVAMWRTIGR